MKKHIAKFGMLFLTISLNADCLVDYSIMYVLAGNERHKTRNIGYPYLISFNNAGDAKKVRGELKLNWLDKRTVDCKEFK